MTSRCPACWNNFRQLYCQQTCSPDQSMFTNPVTVNEFGKHEIDEVKVFFSYQFKEGLFNSCKDMIFPGTNERILSLICGTTADKCTPQILMEYLGSINNGLSSFRIDYPQKLPPHEQGLQFKNVSASKCSKAFVDPVTNHTVPPPVPIVPQPHKIMGMSVLVFALGLSFIVLLVILFPISVICNLKQNRKTSRHLLINRDHQESMPSYSKPGPCEWLGNFLEGKFMWWRHWCSHHPFVVMVASIVVVAIFASVWIFFKVMADPIQLWSSPGSQARKEKDIFDTKFAPFYRTEQIIVQATHPKNDTGYEQYSDGGFVPFGPIFEKSLMNKILELQLAVTSMNVPYTENGETHNITLKDICFKPLEPYNSECAIQSVFQYFQNNVTFFDKCVTSLGYACDDPMAIYDVQFADFHDHFLFCVSNPFSINDPMLGGSCLSRFGAPISPDVILGGFNKTAYKNASTLIITFVVNNHKNQSKLGKALAWEKAFIKYMKDYTENPMNSNLTISFVADHHSDQSHLGKALALEKAFIKYMRDYTKNPMNSNLTIQGQVQDFGTGDGCC